MSVGAIIGCIVVGGFFIYNHFYSGAENRKISSWPKTNGTILKTKYFPGGPRSAPRMMLQYEFVVNDRRYQSDKIYTRHEQYYLNNEAQMHDLDFVKRPVVMYNPENPENCCLILYPTNWLTKVMLILGIALLLIGLIGLIFKFKR